MMSGGYQTADIAQIWPKTKKLPLVGGLVTQWTSAKCGKKMMPLIRGLATQRTLAECGKK
jgi:hypothetical protein